MTPPFGTFPKIHLFWYAYTSLTKMPNHNDLFGNNFKVTMEAQLGLIGGTMGLLTGFSILSGIEIIYYLLRLLSSFLRLLT